MLRNHLHLHFVLAISAVALLTGCGPTSSVDLGQVSGTVTMNGEPVPGLVLIFQPVGGRPSYGRTDNNGHYTMRFTLNHDGVKTGKAGIYFDPFTLEADPESPLNTERVEVDKTQFKKIPKEFFEVFRTEVIEPGSNVIDIDIS
ncbi:Ig-like domain-containing protein [Bremerella sp. JC770]|uniref:Ig-like domain-containing protein n=1 Tax=Bremerella sp. JC770 TaxID=3232137 RepID=UPI0034577888